MAMSVPNPFSAPQDMMPGPLWSGGPVPGSFYQFPGSANKPSVAQPITHTLRPMVTGSSVLGIVFEDGVMLAADTLGSYGSMARFRSLSRLRKVTDTCVVGSSGDYADFQYMEKILEYLIIEAESLEDGHSYTPSALFSWLTTVLYNRRTKINPLWNTVILGGYRDDKPFLGQINSQGIAFESPTLATGLGSYIAQPLLRDAYAKSPAMSREEAKSVIERCLRVLFYRDTRSLNKYEIAVITSEGVDISEPTVCETDWSIASYVRGYD